MGWDLCAGLFYEHRFAVLIRRGHFIGTLPVLEIKAISVSALQSMKVGIGTFLKQSSYFGKSSAKLFA